MPLSARGDLVMRNHLAVIKEDREEIIRSAGMRKTKSTERVAHELRGGAKLPLSK